MVLGWKGLNMKLNSMDKEKELMDFVKDLYGRGLLSKPLDEFDYEKVIWEYLRKKIDQHLPIPPLPREVEGHGW